MSQAQDNPSREPVVWICLVIVLATVAAYWPALRGGFIWNDTDYVTQPPLRSLSGLWKIWFEVGATEQYYPLLHSTFWLEHRLWGDAVLGYHLTNVLLHATAACLLLVILRRMQIPGAWLAAAIFALHPVCVESVAWISEQKNTLSTVLYLAAARGYLDFDETRRPRTYWTATAFFGAALLSKSVTATLVGALLVTQWWRRGRLTWERDFRPLVPWLVAGAAVAAFTGWVEHSVVGAKGGEFALSFAQRCIIAGRAIWFYFGKLIWPADLIFIYPRWDVQADQLWQWGFLAAAFVVLGIFWALRHRTRTPLAALLIYAGTLAPTLGFFNIYAFIYSFVADHWQYLASMAVIVPLAAGWARWRARTRGALPVVAALTALAGLGVLSWRQSQLYTGIETFYRLTLAKNPRCWMAHNNLGILLVATGRVEEAIAHYREAIHILPNHILAHNNMGVALELVPGRLPEAIEYFRKAVRLRPDFSMAHANLGEALSRDPAQIPEAIKCYHRAFELDPNNVEAHNNFANLLARLSGRAAEAEEHYRRALQLRPNFVGAHCNYASFLARRPGRLPEALAHYEEALRIDPAYYDAQLNLANELAQIPARRAEALAHYQAAVRLRPNSPDPHNNLAVFYATGGQFPEAIREFGEALRLDPSNENTRRNLETARSEAQAHQPGRGAATKPSG